MFGRVSSIWTCLQYLEVFPVSGGVSIIFSINNFDERVLTNG